MFSLLKSRPTPIEAAAPPPPDLRPVVMAIAAVLARRPLPALGGFDAALAAALVSLDRALADRDVADLQRAVQYSMSASEVATATSRTLIEIADTSSSAIRISAGAEELTASITELSRQVERTSEGMQSADRATVVCADATTRAAEASEGIGHAFAGMSAAAAEVSEGANQIASFVGTIEALAQQTNLLALNATIEAARAGEAGRGFAVVATEVKALSGQTRKATDDIRERIQRLEAQVKALNAGVGEVQHLVAAATRHAGAAKMEIDRVRGIVSTEAETMRDVAGVLARQSEAVTEIATGVHVIADKAKAAADHTGIVLAAAAGTDRLSEEQIRDFETRTVRDYVLHRAKSDHLLWKKRVAELLSGRASLSASELSDHRQCRLGHWYAEVTDDRLRLHPAFAALEKPHAAVHEAGREAVRLYGQGNVPGALAALDRLEKASKEVVALLDRLIAA